MALILIVEDVPESAELAAQILARYGHEALLADDGLRGLELAQKHVPDLIIYDYMLPDLDGRQFLDRLWAVSELSQIPVIACSASPRDLIEKSVGLPGFHDFISKPFRLSLFMSVVDRHLPLE